MLLGIFSFNGIFFQRFYRSQLRPKEWTRKVVFGDNVTEVIDCIWDTALVKIERQVFFENDTPKWSDCSEPTVNDAGEFITLQDTTRKKLYSIERLTSRILTGWREKTVRVYVYPWSTTVETNGNYQSVQRNLLLPQNSDRAGASSVRDEAALAEELRDKHSHLHGHGSSWLLWANVIHSSPAHKHEEMKNASYPPSQLSKYFQWVPSSEQGRLDALHKAMVVTQNNNSGWMREVGQVKQVILSARDTVDGTRRMLDGALAKIEELERRGSVNDELYDSMEHALRPEETEISRILAEKVTDCDDVDHNHN